MLSGDFKIENEKYYAGLFTSFLNLPTIEKILISDIFNFFLFSLNNDLLKIVAKSSIMIKFKYVLLRRYENDNKNNNIYDLGVKVNENIHQFGEIRNNVYFKNYLDENFPKGSSNYIPDNNNNNYNNTNHMNNIQNNNNNNNNINNNNNNNDNKNNNDNNSGFFSMITKRIFNTESNSTRDPSSYTEEEKSKMTPEERWVLEHPGEPESYYDPQLKRYVLRGQIYDDQEEVIQKKEKERPMIPPPKMKKTPVQNNNNVMMQFNNNNNILGNNNNSSSSDNKNVNINNNVNTNTKINNPFSSARKPPKIQPPQRGGKNNLQNRYAVGYNN